MKQKLVTILFISIVIVGFKSNFNIPDFSGNWHAETATSEFNLNLSQIKNKLSGSHCSVQMNGKKIDCVDDDTELSLFGTIENSSTVLVIFTSQFSLKKGTATIKKLSDTTIEWQIVTKPSGEYHIPNRITLKKAN
jgi:hypothetical protein